MPYNIETKTIDTKVRGVNSQVGFTQDRQAILYMIAQQPDLVESIHFEGLDVILEFSRPINSHKEFLIGQLLPKYIQHLQTNNITIKGFKVTGTDRPFNKENEIENRSRVLGLNLSIILS